MKVTGIETLGANAGWRNAHFLKVMTDEGIVGWSEFSEHTGTQGITGVIHALAELVKGRDPHQVEQIAAFLRARTMQAGGGVNTHGIAALINALYDIKGKSLGVPVYQLFGGKVRDRLTAYWSHCGQYRLNNWKVMGKPEIKTFDDVAKIGAECRKLGFSSLKTGAIRLDGKKIISYVPGLASHAGWPELNAWPGVIESTVRWMKAFAEGAGPNVGLAIDVNFSFKTEGYLELMRALEKGGVDLMWLELDNYEPNALSRIRYASPYPIASLEAQLGRRMLKPFLDHGTADVCIIDTTWNGYLEAMKMASLCEIHEVNVATHAYCAGGLGDFISAHFAAAIPNFRITEFDVDDVPWKHEFLTKELVVEKGDILVPDSPGWGVEVNEKGLKKHPIK